MLKRLLLAMVLAVSGLMLAISPVAALALPGKLACGEEMQAAMHHAAQGHDGHHMPAADQAREAHADGQADPVGICCDHGSLVDLPLQPRGDLRVERVTPVLTGWTADDHADLTGPFGLRRPPKA